MNETIRKPGLNSFGLKLIAITAMLIDHVGAALFPQYPILRIIGRIAFPIFCFLLVEGFLHTHDVIRYIRRMGMFALISEIPFDLLFYGKILDGMHQNVFFTLFLGLIMLYYLTKQYPPFMNFLMVVLFMLLAEFLRTDYSSMGLLIILCFWVFRRKKVWMCLSVAAVNIFLQGYIQVFAVLALPFILLYNGEQGPRMKYVFYLFYPLHLLLLFVIRMSMYSWLWD